MTPPRAWMLRRPNRPGRSESGDVGRCRLCRVDEDVALVGTAIGIRVSHSALFTPSPTPCASISSPLNAGRLIKSILANTNQAPCGCPSRSSALGGSRVGDRFRTNTTNVVIKWPTLRGKQKHDSKSNDRQRFINTSTLTPHNISLNTQSLQHNCHMLQYDFILVVAQQQDKYRSFLS